MTSPTRVSHVTYTLALLAFCAAAGVAQAAEPAYPNRAIRLVVGWPTGGGADALARILAPKLSDAMGQNWIVDNRGGAAGNLGSELVARANPDGYTVMLALDVSITVNPILYKLPFSVEKDLQPVALLSTNEYVLAVHPSVPARTLNELIALAKRKPGALNYASSGVGGAPNLAGELLKKRAGIDMVHVPYKGGGPSAVAVLAGETEVLFASVASTIAFINTGRLRAVATTGAKRSKLTPEVPTIAESGFPGYEVPAWNALFVPGATPNIIVERIRKEVLNTLQHPDVQASMARIGLDPVTTSVTLADLAARIKAESSLWAGVIKDAGIRAE